MTDRYIVCMSMARTSLKDMAIIPEEIIEFQMALFREADEGGLLNKADHFKTFVKPEKKMRLSPYCQRATGITQTEAFNGNTFKALIMSIRDWLRKHEVFGKPGILIFRTSNDVALLEKHYRRYNVFKPGFMDQYITLEALEKRPRVSLEPNVPPKCGDQMENSQALLSEHWQALKQGLSMAVLSDYDGNFVGYQLPKRDPNRPQMKQVYDYILILDFEATCHENRLFKQREENEIIEIGSVLIDVRAETWKIVEGVSLFIKPVINPTLTDFCIKLTSISQEDVDGAKEFEEVFLEYQKFVTERTGGSDKILTATCGDWDLMTMLPLQLKLSKIDKCPAYLQEWFNLKFMFMQHTGIEIQRGESDMKTIMSGLDLTDEISGTEHRAIDDSINFAKAVIELGKFITLKPTKSLKKAKKPS